MRAGKLLVLASRGGLLVAWCWSLTTLHLDRGWLLTLGLGKGAANGRFSLCFQRFS